MDDSTKEQQESGEGSSRTVTSVAQAAGERALQILEKPAPNSTSACIAVALASLHTLHAMVRPPLRRDARHVLELPHADPAAKRALSRVLAFDQNLEAVLSTWSSQVQYIYPLLLTDIRSTGCYVMFSDSYSLYAVAALKLTPPENEASSCSEDRQRHHCWALLLSAGSLLLRALLESDDFGLSNLHILHAASLK